MFLCNCRQLHVVVVEMPTTLDLTLHTGDGTLTRPEIMIVLALIFCLPVGEVLHKNGNVCFSSNLKLKSSGVFEAFVPIRHLWERHASTEVPLMLSHRAPSILLGPHEEISEYIV